MPTRALPWPFAALCALVMNAAVADERNAGPYTISFASFAPLNTDIFIADADGGNARPLLPHPDLDYDATFSPDGAWVYFSSRRDGSSDIYRARLDGSSLERLIDDPAYDDQAALSPDGKSLAFVSSRSGQADIWILDLKSRGLRNITNHPAGDFRPAWSPDGKSLAFSSDRDSKRPKGGGGFALAHSTEIYVMNVDGSNVRRITHDDEVVGSPRWSADGSKLVFYHATLAESFSIASPSLKRGTTHIVSHDLASGERRVLTSVSGEKRSPQWLTDGRIGYASDGPQGGIELVGGTPGARGEFKNPTWSADGKHMLFHRDVDKSWPPHRRWRSRDPQFQLMRTGVFSSWSPAGDRMISNDRTAGILHNSILVMNPDGSERSTIFTDREKSALAPVWSPRGDRIAFALGRFFQMSQGAAQADIASIGIDGKSLHVHTDGRSNYGFPSWSRDGLRLVYREASKTRNALHIVDLEDGRSRVLITGPAHYNFPGWSPKADVIAFTSDMDGDYEIYTIRADGTGLKRLTHAPGNDAHSAWSADGEWIAFSSGRSGFKDEGLLYQANPQAYGEIYVMRADGSDVRALTDDQFEEATLGWRPMGGALAD